MNFRARKAYNWLNCLSVFSKWRHNSTLPRSPFTRSWSIRYSTSTEHKKLGIWLNPKIFSKKYSPKHEDFFKAKKNLGVRCTLSVKEAWRQVMLDVTHIVTNVSINLLTFYHECRSLIGYATHVLFCDRQWVAYQRALGAASLCFRSAHEADLG